MFGYIMSIDKKKIIILIKKYDFSVIIYTIYYRVYSNEFILYITCTINKTMYNKRYFE